MANTVPIQLPLNYDYVTGRFVFNLNQSWEYGALVQNVAARVTSGATFQVPDNVNNVFVNPAAVLAALAITMPVNPQDGDVVKFIFGGAIAAGTAVVTTLTVVGSGTQKVYGTITNPVDGGVVLSYLYDATSNEWYLIS